MRRGSPSNFEVGSIAALLRQTELNLSVLHRQAAEEPRPFTSLLGAPGGAEAPGQLLASPAATAPAWAAPGPATATAPVPSAALQLARPVATAVDGGALLEIEAQLLQLRGTVEGLERRVEEDLRSFLGVCEKRFNAKEDQLRGLGDGVHATVENLADSCSRRVDAKLRELERLGQARSDAVTEDVWESIRRLQADTRTIESRLQRCALEDDLSDQVREAEKALQQRVEERLLAFDRRSLEHRSQQEGSAEALREALGQRCDALEQRVWEKQGAWEDVVSAVLKRLPELQPWRELQEELKAQAYAAEVQKGRVGVCEAKFSKLGPLETKLNFLETHTNQQLDEQSQTCRTLNEATQRLGQRLLAMESSGQHAQSQLAALELQLRAEVEQQRERAEKDVESLQQRLLQRFDDVDARMQRTSSRIERDIAQQLAALSARVEEEGAGTQQQLQRTMQEVAEALEDVQKRLGQQLESTAQEAAQGLEEGHKRLEEQLERTAQEAADALEEGHRRLEAIAAELQQAAADRSAEEKRQVEEKLAELEALVTAGREAVDGKLAQLEARGAEEKQAHDEKVAKLEVRVGEETQARDEKLGTLEIRVQEVGRFVEAFQDDIEEIKGRSMATARSQVETFDAKIGRTEGSITEMRLNLDDLRRSGAGLEAEVRAGNSHFETRVRALEEQLQEESRQLHSQTAGAATSLQRLQSGLDELQLESRQSRGQAAELGTTVQRLQSGLEVARGQLAGLESRLQAQAASASGAEARAEQAAARADGRVEHGLRALEEQLQAAEQRLQGGVEAARGQAVSLEARLEEQLQAAVQRLQGGVEAARGQAASLEARLEAQAVSSASTVETRLEQLNARSEGRLESCCRALEEQFQVECRQLRGQAADLAEQMQRLQSGLEEQLQAESRQSRQQVAELEVARAHVSSLESRLESQAASTAGWDARVEQAAARGDARLDSCIRSLEERLQVESRQLREATRAQLVNLEARVESQASTAAGVDSRLEQLRFAVARLEATLAAQESVGAPTHSSRALAEPVMQPTGSELNDAIHRLRNSIEGAHAHLASLENRLEVYSRGSAAMEGALASVRSDVEGLHAGLAGLRELDRHGGGSVAQQASAAELAAQVAQHGAQLRSLQEELAALRSSRPAASSQSPHWSTARGSPAATGTVLLQEPIARAAPDPRLLGVHQEPGGLAAHLRDLELRFRRLEGYIEEANLQARVEQLESSLPGGRSAGSPPGREGQAAPRQGGPASPMRISSLEDRLSRLEEQGSRLSPIAAAHAASRATAQATIVLSLAWAGDALLQQLLGMAGDGGSLAEALCSAVALALASPPQPGPPGGCSQERSTMPEVDVLRAELESPGAPAAPGAAAAPRRASCWLAAYDAAAAVGELRRQLGDPNSALRGLLPGLLPESSVAVADAALLAPGASDLAPRVDDLERSRELFAEGLEQVERRVLYVERLASGALGVGLDPPPEAAAAAAPALGDLSSLGHGVGRGRGGGQLVGSSVHRPGVFSARRNPMSPGTTEGASSYDLTFDQSSPEATPRRQQPAAQPPPRRGGVVQQPELLHHHGVVEALTLRELRRRQGDVAAAQAVAQDVMRRVERVANSEEESWQREAVEEAIQEEEVRRQHVVQDAAGVSEERSARAASRVAEEEERERKAETVEEQEEMPEEGMPAAAPQVGGGESFGAMTSLSSRVSRSSSEEAGQAPGVQPVVQQQPMAAHRVQVPEATSPPDGGVRLGMDGRPDQMGGESFSAMPSLSSSVSRSSGDEAGQAPGGQRPIEQQPMAAQRIQVPEVASPPGNGGGDLGMVGRLDQMGGESFSVMRSLSSSESRSSGEEAGQAPDGQRPLEKAAVAGLQRPEPASASTPEEDDDDDDDALEGLGLDLPDAGAAGAGPAADGTPLRTPVPAQELAASYSDESEDEEVERPGASSGRGTTPGAAPPAAVPAAAAEHGDLERRVPESPAGSSQPPATPTGGVYQPMATAWRPGAKAKAALSRTATSSSASSQSSATGASPDVGGGAAAESPGVVTAAARGAGSGAEREGGAAAESPGMVSAAARGAGSGAGAEGGSTPAGGAAAAESPGVVTAAAGSPGSGAEGGSTPDGGDAGQQDHSDIEFDDDGDIPLA